MAWCRGVWSPCPLALRGMPTSHSVSIFHALQTSPDDVSKIPPMLMPSQCAVGRYHAERLTTNALSKPITPCCSTCGRALHVCALGLCKATSSDLAISRHPAVAKADGRDRSRQRQQPAQCLQHNQQLCETGLVHHAQAVWQRCCLTCQLPMYQQICFAVSLMSQTHAVG